MEKIAWAVMVLSIWFGMTLTAHAQWPLGNEPAQNAPKRVEPAGGITQSGRYQVFASPNIKGHTFMLDTESGRVWIMKKDNLSGDFSLQRIPVDQVDDVSGKVVPKNTGKNETK